MKNNNIIFGPVASRRLGLSLGIDLLPPKTCSLNCIYCEVGKTTKHTIERGEFYPFEEVINCIDEALRQNPNLDYITFAGSGEPTLYSRFGDVVTHLKTNYPQYKVCLLTNSTLLFDPEVRKELMDVDVVVPSLDAATEDAFKKINKNLRHNPLSQIIDGLYDFANEYKGDLQLEVFIVPGINDSEKEIDAIVEVAKKIRPSHVQLNSLDRPGVDPNIMQATPSSLNDIADAFAPLDVIIASKFKGQSLNIKLDDLENLVIDTTKRRPCTLMDFVDITGLKKSDIENVLNRLIAENKLRTYSEKRGVFYTSRQ